ncbi:glycosyltransferase [Candidatus Thiodictyon syntrophicum]|jgi:glycosyltransferase involved in cell wall biosynthesis|uniref:Glycosyltransferase subfamily 4-like N-terminal domain-containing protein n=1 Tax=Candidatus Thiodictyon syntrophicum TaxID=1166950 RepID=A0A2K8UHG5_9GAMM|nr:glycosyltransferase [Candidatus Thiodictyon syntrophicum]AUB84541.1 hypothetical protein THSYN_28825 [Candidatus Thiodictyon syntrophicum]
MSDLLVFSYAFPPMRVQMAPVVAKPMAGLARRGHRIDVVTAQAFGPHLGEDDSLSDYTAQHFRSIQRLSPDDRLLTRRWRYSPRWAATPDLMALLHRQALAYLLSLDLGRYAAVITWSPFHSVNTVMARVKAQRPRVKWIAQFSDPWAGNPLEHSRVTRLWNTLRQPQTVRSADFIVHSSAYSRDLMFAGAGRNRGARSAVIPHAYDPSLYPSPPRQANDRIVLRYVGVLFGRRSPEYLFQALRVLFCEHPLWRDRVCLEIVGTVPPEMLQTPAARALQPDVLVIRTSVSYLESLRLMRDADLLVLIEADTRLNLFVPSKLSDYIGARRPILGLAPPGGSYDLLCQVGATIRAPTDVSGIAAALHEALSAIADGADLPENPAREELSTEAVAMQFEAVLGEVAS